MTPSPPAASAPTPLWSVAAPPAWPGARTPAVLRGIVVLATHRHATPTPEGDVVVLAGFDARSGALAFEARTDAGGKPVRTGPPGFDADGLPVVGTYAQGKGFGFLRVDRAGRQRGSVLLPDACAFDGRPHPAAGPLADAVLGRPRFPPSGGVVLAWASGGVVCCERRDSLDAKPRWAAAAWPLALAGDSVLLREDTEETSNLVARDATSGEVRWSLPGGGDLEVLGAHGDLLVVVDVAPRADEIDARLADDPEMLGNPVIEAPVRVVGLDAATGAERWALGVPGDVGSAWVGEEGVLLASAREDGSGGLWHVRPEGRLAGGFEVVAPSEANPDEPPLHRGVPRVVGVERGMALWQGPDGIAAAPLSRLDAPAWSLDDPPLRVPALVASTAAPLWPAPAETVARDGVLVARAEDRLLAFFLG